MISNDFRRVEYTEEDDQNLIKYIAEKIPYLEAGGRLGNNLYLELEENVRTQSASVLLDSAAWRYNDCSPFTVVAFFDSDLSRMSTTRQKSLYPWAQRHSWHSWRNRYKMRQLIFDVAIREYVHQHPPAADGTRPAHPALIALDNACDRDEDDQARDDDSSAQADGTGGGNRTGKRKGKTGRQKKKRTRSPSPSSSDSDSDADGVDSRLWVDEDPDENDAEGGEDARALGRQPDKRPAPKRRRTKTASTIDGDEDGGE